MVDVTSSRKEVTPNSGMKMVLLKSGTTVVAGTDTLTLDQSDYGLTQVLGVESFIHTTDGSVIVNGTGTATTAVAADTLTYTTESGNTNKRRVLVVWGE